MSCLYIKEKDEDYYFDIIIDIQLMDLYKEYEEKENFKYDIKYFSVLGLTNKYINGEWNLEYFCTFFEDNIIFSALSKEELDSLDKPKTKLKKAFYNLKEIKKKDNDKIEITDGEVGEVFLYGIMYEYYDAINLVPKIFYKQNRNDNVKGADSVHITISNKEIGIWFGEAKFYLDIKSAISQAVSSISEFFENLIYKELSISYPYLKDYKNDIDKESFNKLKYLLKEENIDKLKEYLHVPILILYEEEKLKDVKSIDEFISEEINSIFIDNAMSLLKKQIIEFQKHNIFKYESIKIHIIFFPILNKKDIMVEINYIKDFYLRK